MFYAKVGDATMVYTGDYNMTPDRHLGAAQIDRLNLDLLISEYGMSFFCILFGLCTSTIVAHSTFSWISFVDELRVQNLCCMKFLFPMGLLISRLLLIFSCHRSTYATTIRDSKYAREREFLRAVSK